VEGLLRNGDGISGRASVDNSDHARTSAPSVSKQRKAALQLLQGDASKGEAAAASFSVPLFTLLPRLFAAVVAAAVAVDAAPVHPLLCYMHQLLGLVLKYSFDLYVCCGSGIVFHHHYTSGRIICNTGHPWSQRAYLSAQQGQRLLLWTGLS